MGISSIGIGSGLTDVQGTIDKLVALQKRPLTMLQTNATFMQTQISTYGKVQGLVAGLNTAAANLAKPALWNQNAAGSTNTSVSASASAGATAGSYSVEVSQLAAAHSLASRAFADSKAELGAGKLKIQFGSWTAAGTNPPSAATFAEKAGSKPLELSFDAATTTLEDVRKAINDSKAGVTASIVRDASGARLTIRSDKTGEVNALRISASDADGNALSGGLAALNYTPDTGAAGGMLQSTAAGNAKAKVNGLDVVSDTNTFTGAIENVSLTVSGITTTPATVSVSADNGSQRKAVQDFATAFNALNSLLLEQTKYDEKSKIGGTLQGDSTVLNLRNQMRNILRDTGAGNFSFFSMVSKDGTVSRDGSLTIDTGALDKALADTGKLGKLFAGQAAADGKPAIPGMAQRLASFTDALTKSGGSLTARTDGLNSKLKINKTEQDKVSDRLDRVRSQLEAQYQALDTKMAGINSLAAYVNQQVTNWNK